jgi:nucleoside-diphosphate-sugar epimerase
VAGDLADAATLEAALAGNPDLVFHMAAVPGGTAERDYELGYRVNIGANCALIDALRRPDRPRRVVATSSIAVFGASLPEKVDDNTMPTPSMSYGTHKRIMELLLDDLSRRGDVDARVVRLPGILARPRQAGGHVSAYMSNVFYAIAADEPFVCPVSSQAPAWFMSVERCVDNLLHAAEFSSAAFGRSRVCTLPALRLRMDELIAAIQDVLVKSSSPQISYAPQEAVEAQFGRYPPLVTTEAERLGYRHDGSAQELVRRALRHAGIAVGR